MKPTSLTGLSLKYLMLFLFSAVTFLYSCKKTDIKPVNENVVERFLKLPDNITSQVNRIIEDLKAKERENPFIENFVANVGYPLWEHAKIKRLIPGNNLLAREASEEIIEIPVVLDQKEFVNALLQVKMNEEVLYKLFEGHNWESYGFDKDAALNADKVITKLMEYEKVIWNNQFFKIDDNRLFNYWPVGVDKPASFYIGLQTNDITNDNVVYVYDDCDENGGTTGGDTGDGDGDDWTYTNGGQIDGGIAVGQPWIWVEPNGTGTSGSPSGPKPICLTDIIHISGGTGGSEWSSTPIYSTSGGSSTGGGSGGGDGPCTPFPWGGLGIRTGSGQYQALFNPCFEEVPPPLDNGNGEVSDPCSTNSQTLGVNTTAIFNNVNLAAAKAEMTANYDNEKSFSFGTQTVNGQTQMAATPVQTGAAGESPFVATDPNISITGGMHIHIGGHPEPSVNDIIQLANVNANTNPGYTTEFVVNESGEKYAIVIIDAGKAESFYNKYKNSFVPGGGWAQGTKIGDEFYDIKRALKYGNNQSEPNAHMLAQAFILRKYKSGIALLQQQADGTFHEIHQQVTMYRNSPTTYITTICP